MISGDVLEEDAEMQIASPHDRSTKTLGSAVIANLVPILAVPGAELMVRVHADIDHESPLSWR